MNNTNPKTRQLVQSSLLTSLMVVFSLLGTLPLFDMVSIAVAPLIVALIYHKGGKGNTIISFVVTMILVSILISPIYGITLALLNYITGMGLIFMIERKTGPLVNFLVLALAVGVGYVVMFSVNLSIMGSSSLTEFLSLIIDEMKIAVTEMKTTYETMGVDMKNNPAVTMIENLTPGTIITLIPTLLALYAMISSAFIYKVSSLVFKKLGIHVEAFPKLSAIKANMHLIIATLLLSMLGILGVKLGFGWAEGYMLLGNNLFTLVGAVGGISLLSYFLEYRLKYPAVIRIVLLVLVGTSNMISLISIVGILDSAFDFRTLSGNGLYKLIRSRIDNTK